MTVEKSLFDILNEEQLQIFYRVFCSVIHPQEWEITIKKISTYNLLLFRFNTTFIVFITNKYNNILSASLVHNNSFKKQVFVYRYNFETSCNILLKELMNTSEFQIH